MRVDFYHLSRDPAPVALAQIAAKALEAGQRMLVVSDDAEQASAISDALWAAPGFLANGEAGEHGDARQPILIAPDAADAPNGARLVALADGQWRDEALSYDRALLLFDAQTIDGARGAWRALGDSEGVERHYWKFVDGRWVVGP
ncbi:DNA polymerase III subunit chi [Croceicoccus bisphenolivorans]|uniref:DNA polymerase III subunit chi n=1 Tax=Croceicoccus bisphenolivorans TaxID=1783232 RepID=UPI00083613D1|nr:DNA polymerase III subunit chi [Croceicoccus bisphenolivorans]